MIKDEFTLALNTRTREAVRDVLSEPAWDGKTLVMVWEDDHIADAALEAKFPREPVTLRQLLAFDKLAGVPATWPGENYDYFWVVDFARDSGQPTGFAMVRQAFPPPFENVPANEWGKPDGLTRASGCEGATG